MTDWNVYSKKVLVVLFMDCQLPGVASPSRQDKATLVEALERYERTRGNKPSGFGVGPKVDELRRKADSVRIELVKKAV